jgi:hypothetical protein
MPVPARYRARPFCCYLMRGARVTGVTDFFCNLRLTHTYRCGIFSDVTERSCLKEENEWKAAEKQ